MNQDRKNHDTAVIDPQVAAQYELLADEATPPELDRAVMRNAGSAVRTDARRGPFAAWFRPVAFVAIAGVSLAIVIDLSDIGVFQTPAVTAPGIRQPVAAQPKAATAPGIALKKRTAADAADALRREKATPAPLSKMAAPNAMVDLAVAALEQCRDDMTSGVEDWWNCIAQLRQAGMTEFAASQLRSLTEAYPDFKPPAPVRATDGARTRRPVPE